MKNYQMWDLDNIFLYNNNKILPMDQFVVAIGQFISTTKFKIHSGEKYKIAQDEHSKFLKDYLDNCFIEKDEFGDYWFITSNKELVKIIIKKYFFKDAWDLIRSIDVPMMKKEICKKTKMPRSSTNFLINDLIDMGILINVGVTHTKRPVNIYLPFFNEMKISFSTKTDTLKLKLNKKLINKMHLIGDMNNHERL